MSAKYLIFLLFVGLTMYPDRCCFLLCLLVLYCGQCLSLFYTNSRENDYPRIGKRLQLFKALRSESSFPKHIDSTSAVRKLTDRSKFSHGVKSKENLTPWDKVVEVRSILKEDEILHKEPVIVQVLKEMPILQGILFHYCCFLSFKEFFRKDKK